MTFSSAEYRSVFSHLKSLNIQVSEEWVAGSVKRCKSLNRNASSAQINNAVFQEWLSVNLRDIKVPSLPPNLSSQGKVTLTGVYAVQVESFWDCSKSCYSQLQTIQNGGKKIEVTEKSNEEEINNSKRCLNFKLSDGVQEIEGMEYEYISSIKSETSSLLPGFKMLIKGPVVCRKGMLLLKEANVKIYGGKVEALCETNNLLSLLHKQLGLKESTKLKETQATVNGTNFIQPNFPEETMETFDSALELTSNKPDDKCDLLSDNNDLFENFSFEENDLDKSLSEVLDNEEKALFGNQNEGINYVAEVNSNDFSYVHGNRGNAVEIEEIDEEKDVIPIQPKKAKLELSSGFSENISSSSTRTNNTFQNIQASQSSGYHNKSRGSSDFSITSTYNVTNSMNIEHSSQAKHEMKSLSRLPTSETNKKAPEKVDSYPFVYLKQINEIPLLRPTNFIIKGIILTLKSKISIKNDEFMLMASITDGSCTSLVNFSSVVLEEILEYSPCEITSMMMEKSKNLAVSERLKQIFLSAQQKLLSMNCLMEIKFFNDASLPCVVRIEEVQMKHVNALKARKC